MPLIPPEFDPSNFAADSNRVTNNYLPLVPGTQLIYNGVANSGGGLSDHQVIFTVTDLVRIIDGVKVVVVWDQDIQSGVLQEAELAFFAQDKDGNVWNLGEYPEIYRNGAFTGAPDTWISGEKDAQGGLHMLARPHVGTTYVQGIVPSIEFNDEATVVDRGEKLSVAGQSYTRVLATEEGNPDDPLVRQGKFYAPDVGIVKITPINDPEAETLDLVGVRHLSKGELALASQAALALENRAYAISKIYAAADPAGRFNNDNGGDDEPRPVGEPGEHFFATIVEGTEKNDKVVGYAFPDELLGFGGRDILKGLAGDDVLDGGAGNDRYKGGRGADTFVFADLENGIVEKDRIKDFSAKQGDLVELPNGAASVASEQHVHGGWELTLEGDGDTILVLGVRDVKHDGSVLDDLGLL